MQSSAVETSGCPRATLAHRSHRTQVGTPRGPVIVFMVPARPSRHVYFSTSNFEVRQLAGSPRAQTRSGPTAGYGIREARHQEPKPMISMYLYWTFSRPGATCGLCSAQALAGRVPSRAWPACIHSKSAGHSLLLMRSFSWGIRRSRLPGETKVLLLFVSYIPSSYAPSVL